MDKSIRLPLVLGELKVPAYELDTDEWFKVVTHTLELCRPQIKYFPGFRSVEDIAVCELPRSRTKDFKIMSGNSPVNLSDQPRCIRLTRAEKHRGRGGEDNIILLTQKSEILRWHRLFVWEGPFGSGFFSERLWRFEYLHGHDLKEYLSPQIGLAILRNLAIAANQGYVNRMRHAESMRTLNNKLDSLSSKFA